jgi:Tol biopolymer transport system component
MKGKITFALIIMTGLLLSGLDSFSQTAEELLPKALQLEEVNGELEQAIELYQEIIKDYPENKPIAAKAQFHIGLCYEKLGMEQAQKAYREVVDNYPGQENEVAMAMERLASLKRAQTDLNHLPTFQKIEIASNPQNGVLSPDGEKFAFFSDGAVWIIPLHGKVNQNIAGEPIMLAEIPGGWDNGSLMAWSADGKWIAVNSMIDDESAAYIIPVDGGEPRVVALPDRGGHIWSYDLSLSPDGQILTFSAIQIGTQLQMPNPHKRYIYTIPTSGGKPKQVSSGWARHPSFSPDGQLIAYVGYRNRDDSQENNEGSLMTGELWVATSIGNNPVKLANVDGRLRGPVWSPDRKYIAAHNEPGGSNDSKEIWVYPLTPDASSAGEPRKITLPNSSWNLLAGWTPNEELGVFIQSEEHTAIYTVPASGGKAVQITPEGGWPYYPRWSQNGEHIYFRMAEKMVDKEEYKITVRYVPAAGGNPIEVPVQPQRWLVSIVPGGGHNISPDGQKMIVSAYQEPYNPDEGGDLWMIPLEGGSPTRLTNDKTYERYPCWSPDGKWIAFVDFETENNDFPAIYTIDSDGGKMREITSRADSLEEGAIAFSRDGKHIAFFSAGAIKTIPVNGGQPKVLVANIKTRKYSMHSQLAYSPDGSKIAYNANGKIWITLLDDGEPQELLTGLPNNARHSEFGWSPDGEKITFLSNIGGEAEFYLISDFLPLDDK